MKESTLAFLDGDGSIMLQIRPRKDCKYGFRICASIVLYQDCSHEEDLRWIGDQLKVGYIARRNDGMSELRIGGYKQVETVLTGLVPYIRFKRVQSSVMLEALCALRSVRSPQDFLEVCRLADCLSKANYASRRKYTSETVRAVFCERRLLSP